MALIGIYGLGQYGLETWRLRQDLRATYVPVDVAAPPDATARGDLAERGELLGRQHGERVVGDRVAQQMRVAGGVRQVVKAAMPVQVGGVGEVGQGHRLDRAVQLHHV